MAFRPESIRLVPPDSPDATLRAQVALVEPLGARDVVHMRVGDQDVRAALAPGSRPRVGRQRRARARSRPGAPVRRRDRAGGALMASVRLEGVTTCYGSKVALNEVSLDVSDGEFMAVLGPPGAGKTTLLRTIVGLEKPTAGDVFIDDERVNDVWPGDRDISIVFQNLALYPDKTVHDNLALPAQAAQGAQGASAKSASAAPPSCCASSRCSSASRASCRAASASAWPWAGRWCATRASTCSTSRSRRSTPCCGWRCAPSSSTCSATSAARSSTSPTTRSRP